MYISIIKHLASFQKWSSVLHRLCQGTTLYTSSHFKYLQKATCYPRAMGSTVLLHTVHDSDIYSDPQHKPKYVSVMSKGVCTFSIHVKTLFSQDTWMNARATKSMLPSTNQYQRRNNCGLWHICQRQRNPAWRNKTIWHCGHWAVHNAIQMFGKEYQDVVADGTAMIKYFTVHCRHLRSLLTPRGRVHHEKLTGLQLVKKLPAFYGTRRFITALTSARHLSWASSIQFIPVHPTSWRSALILTSHLRLVSPAVSFPQVFPPKPCTSLSIFPHTR
jgi:hypothetical protein